MLLLEISFKMLNVLTQFSEKQGFVFVCKKNVNVVYINPIPAGVLENQDMLGGGQFDPPPLNPMFDVQK